MRDERGEVASSTAPTALDVAHAAIDTSDEDLEMAVADSALINRRRNSKAQAERDVLVLQAAATVQSHQRGRRERREMLRKRWQPTRLEVEVSELLANGASASALRKKRLTPEGEQAGVRWSEEVVFDDLEPTYAVHKSPIDSTAPPAEPPAVRLMTHVEPLSVCASFASCFKMCIATCAPRQ